MKALFIVLVFGAILALLNPGISYKGEIALQARNQDGYKVDGEEIFFYETSIFRQDDISLFFPFKLGLMILTTP